MEIKMFNFWYFFWIFISVGAFFLLYFLLRNRSEKTKRTVLFSILAFALVLHFLKFLIPPYSTDINRLYRDAWFINICAANILLFPFLFLTKSKTVHDYMFYLGVLSGIAATVYPIEPLEKVNQMAEWLDVVRFYVHHSILWIVPLLTVVLGLHKLSYKRCLRVAPCLLALFMFIMINQALQSELGFVPLRGENMFDIPYKNTSYIWGPGDDAIGKILLALCPDFFKTVPVGEFAGQAKVWPWFWLIVPAFVILTPLCFLISLITDHENFKKDLARAKSYLKNRFKKG